MDKIALFCKSYKGDLERCKVLSESIEKHNIDQIPFYVSVPLEDTMMFQSELPYFTEILADEHITNSGHGWVGQQFVKARYYKHELSQYYVCIDSDGYFFKDFCVDDFFWDDETPYMVMHERQSFYEFIDRFNDEIFGEHIDIRHDHEEQYRDIREFLTGDGSGKLYHYGPSPFIWNTEVWKEADDEFGIDLLFSKHATELKWYGELTQYYGFDFIPCGPLFKCFHYEAQYEFYKQLEWTEENFKKQYLGIVMQSNWNSPLRYED